MLKEHGKKRYTVLKKIPKFTGYHTNNSLEAPDHLNPPLPIGIL